MALDANGMGVPVAVFNWISITRITISDRHWRDRLGAFAGRIIGLSELLRRDSEAPSNGGRLAYCFGSASDDGYRPGLVGVVAEGRGAPFAGPGAGWTHSTIAGPLALDLAGCRLVSGAVVPARAEVLVRSGKAISIDSPPSGLLRVVITAPWAVDIASTMERPSP
jgi:hypothetical protein